MNLSQSRLNLKAHIKNQIRPVSHRLGQQKMKTTYALLKGKY
jgi:hypothetical protein